jgi:hypothetical protein
MLSNNISKKKYGWYKWKMYSGHGNNFLEIVKRTLEKKMIESDNECVIALGKIGTSMKQLC